MRLHLKKCWEKLGEHSGVIVYLAIVIAVIVLVGLIQKRSHDSDRKLQNQVERIDRQFQSQARTIVKTGRESIESGCEFDNERAHQIRAILRRSQHNVHELYRKGQITHEFLLRNDRSINESITDITIRDCSKAASVLSLGKAKAKK